MTIHSNYYDNNKAKNEISLIWDMGLEVFIANLGSRIFFSTILSHLSDSIYFSSQEANKNTLDCAFRYFWNIYNFLKRKCCKCQRNKAKR